MTKLQQVYTEAARKVAEHGIEFSCNAIYFPGDPNSPGTLRDRAFYAAVMSPDPMSSFLDVPDIYTIRHNSELSTHLTVEDFRVLLLCMMAACCEDMR